MISTFKFGWPKKNHDGSSMSYARVKIFGNYLMKSPNKPKNFFFHEIHGWPAFAYLDWPKWLQNCPFDEWWSHQVLESLIKKKLNNLSRIILPYCNFKVENFISFEFLLRKKKKKSAPSYMRHDENQSLVSFFQIRHHSIQSAESSGVLTYSGIGLVYKYTYKLQTCPTFLEYARI